MAPRVLFVTSWYPSANDPVTGTFVREHAKAVALYASVVVLHCDLTSDEAAPLALDGDESVFGVPVYRLAIGRASRLSRFARLAAGIDVARRKLEREHGAFDVVHAHVHDVASVAVLDGLLARVPVVVTEHSSIFALGGLSWAGRWRARIGFRLAARVVVVSRELQRAIERTGARASFAVVPNAVDTAMFRPAPSNGAGVGRRILFVGTIDRNKDPEGLVRSFDRLHNDDPGLRLVVVGRGPRDHDLDALIAALGLEDAVDRMGQVSKHDVAGLMRQSAVLAVPSHYETLSCVAIEALCCGVPVVARRVGGLKEVVAHEQDGILVDDLGDDALYRALHRQLSKADDGRQRAERAQARYSLEAVGRSLVDVYAEVVRTRRRRSNARPGS